jgi:succinyl-diaminopimelate desuccinylase
MVNWYEEVVARKEELLQDLFGLLRIESVKDENTMSKKYPMGERVGEALDYMLKLSTHSGLIVKNLDGYAGYGQLGNSSAEDYVGVLCHVDVMPAPGEWTSPPFTPVIRDGKIFARGAIDDKGPTMAAFYAMKIVKELGLPLKRNVRIIFGTDEESGMSCMRHYRDVQPMPLIGFAPDADFPIINAEKGQINIKLSLETTLKQSEDRDLRLSSFQAGERINMVPGRASAVIKGDTSQLLLNFQQFCNNNQIAHFIHRVGDSCELILLGKPAHGMEPQIGINAGTLLASFLQDYPFTGDYRSFLSLTAQLHEDFKGEKLGISYSDTVTGPLTVNPGVISYKENEEESIHLNIRCPVTTNYENTKKKLHEQAEKAGFIIAELRESAPHHVDAEHPMIILLQKVYEEEMNEKAVLLSTGGATYARFMEKGVAFGACFPGKEMTAHQKDEYWEVEDLLKATAIYARAIYELGNLEL